MSTPDRLLAVGRLRKPHGLKGEISVFPLTDTPELAFGQDAEIWVTDLGGEVIAGPLSIERARGYHREWLLKLRGVDSRDALADWRDLLVSADAARLAPLEDDEVYVHDLAGFAVRDQSGEALGIVTDVIELPGGLVIEVQGRKREFLLPYRREFVPEVDREGRTLTVTPPDGLIDD